MVFNIFKLCRKWRVLEREISVNRFFVIITEILVIKVIVMFVLRKGLVGGMIGFKGIICVVRLCNKIVTYRVFL